jgi:hypothetical protein
MLLGSHVGVQHPCMCLPLDYKREGTQRYKDKLLDSQVHIHAYTHSQYNIHTVEVGYYAPAASTTLIPRVLVCSSQIHPTGKTLRPLPHLRIGAGAFRHPDEGFSLRHLARQVGAFSIRFSPVFLLDTMVQIVEHRGLTHEDFLMEEEAASSMPRVSNRPAPGATDVHAVQQHTPAQTSRAPSRAAPRALSAARELLRHPPSSTASPSAMKQWRDDVDHLLGMAHSGSARPRPQSFRRQYEALSSVCSPLVEAAPTEDLRVELNCRRAGEDAPISLERPDDLRAELNRRRTGEDTWVSLERARERRLNFEGRNLDQDFAPLAPQTPRGARIHTGVPLVGVEST